MVEERVLTWWKYGGVNVVEVEKREYLICKNFCLDGNCKNRFHFFFHPVVSTTFFHHVFPPRKIRRRRSVIIIIFLFTF